MSHQPTIVLVNQISRHGHLDTYARLYSGCLLDLGYRVVLLAEHDPQIQDWLRANGQDGADRFTFFSREGLRADMARAQELERERRLEQERQVQRNRELLLRQQEELLLRQQEELLLRQQEELLLPQQGHDLKSAREAALSQSFLARAQRVWRSEGLGGVCIRIGWYSRRLFNLVLNPFKLLLRRLVRRFPILDRILRIWRTEGVRGFLRRLLSHTTQALRKAASTVGLAAWLQRGIGLPEPPSPGINFGPLVDEIKAIEQLHGIKPVLVMFLYLDMMSESRDGTSWLESHLGLPWAGILFHPRVIADDDTTPIERYFLCSNARGAVFLNANPIAFYQKKLPNLVFETVPDVTELAVLPGPFDILRRLRERAHDRTVVLQFGSLAPHKGVLDLLDVIASADPMNYFFVVVGEMFWDSFEPEQANRLRDFLANPPENCLLHFGYLNDERELNTLIKEADVLYAVYRGAFRDSSNTLTKASVFETPVIVSDQYLMGERVRNYRLGAAVQSGDPRKILAGLDSLRMRPKSDFGFAAYRDDHSIEALKSALSRALTAWHGPLA